MGWQHRKVMSRQIDWHRATVPGGNSNGAIITLKKTVTKSSEAITIAKKNHTSTLKKEAV
jgi:hypothetical protein